ncbi:glycoside hydrolase family 97 N-terminal domain-containing protein [candidate division KSB1 bacterium]
MAKRRLMAVAVLITVVSVIIATLEITKRPYAIIDSPDGNIRVTVAVKGETPQEVFNVYSVEYKGSKIIDDSNLGFTLSEGGYLGRNVEIYAHRTMSFDKDLKPLSDNISESIEYFTELTINLHERIVPFRSYNLIFRIFNDGIAFRAVILGAQDIKEIEILSENTEYKFTDNHSIYFPDLIDPNIPNPADNRINNLSDINSDSDIELPLYCKTENDLYAGISQVIQAGQPEMRITGDDNNPLLLKTLLMPTEESQDKKISGKSPLKTPWRIILISDDPEKLQRSDIIRILESSEK